MKSLIKNNNAQGTIEYLVIIAVVVVISLALVTVLITQGENAEQISTNSTKAGSIIGKGGISITDSITSASGDSIISLKNNSGETLTVTKLTPIDDQGNVGESEEYNIDLSPGYEIPLIKQNIDSICPCTAGKTTTCKIKITFVGSSGLEKNETLTITNTCVETVNYFTVNYTAQTGGVILGNTSQKILPGSNASTVTAQANTGYTFLQWSDGSTNPTRTETSITADKNILAEFTLIEEEIRTEWRINFGGTGTQRSASVIKTNDEGYVVLGTNEAVLGESDIYLVKVNSNGNIVWEKNYDFEGYEVAYSLEETTDGGYIISGHKSPIGSGVSLALIIKINSSGNIDWNKTISGYGWSSTAKASSIIQTTDGNYIFTGETISGSSRVVWIVKLDNLGNKIWEKLINFSGYISKGFQILETQDQGFLIRGSSSLGPTTNQLLIKVDSEGNHDWNKTYTGTDVSTVNSFIKTEEGFMLVGKTNSTDYVYGDSWLIKTDSEGTIDWNKLYYTEVPSLAGSIEQTTDGGYIITGNLNPAPYTYNLYLLKVDSEGEVEWTEEYEGTSNKIINTSDEGFVIVGDQDGDIILIKTNSQGQLE